MFIKEEVPTVSRRSFLAKGEVSKAMGCLLLFVFIPDASVGTPTEASE